MNCVNLFVFSGANLFFHELRHIISTEVKANKTYQWFLNKFWFNASLVVKANKYSLIFFYCDYQISWRQIINSNTKNFKQCRKNLINTNFFKKTKQKFLKLIIIVNRIFNWLVTMFIKNNQENNYHLFSKIFGCNPCTLNVPPNFSTSEKFHM